MNTFNNAGVQQMDRKIARRYNGAFLSSAFDQPIVLAEPNSRLKTDFAGLRVHHLSRQEWMRPDVTENDNDLAKTSLFMQALSDSYASHLPFCLSPEMAWFIIAHEIAVHVNLNPERYRDVFTSSNKKEVISVRDDSLTYGESNAWARSISKFLPQIRDMVPQAAVDLLLPKFSTTTDESAIATQILFMHLLSNYFEYEMVTLCGIPSVQVAGNADDWSLVRKQTELASREFPGLQLWFADLLPVLGTIESAMQGESVDPAFWERMYVYDGGCGGNSASVRGWITAFFAHGAEKNKFYPRHRHNWQKDWDEHRGPYVFEFPTHVAFVPFQWEYHKDGIDKHFPMLFSAGVFGVDFEGALSPKLGFAVLESSKPNLSV